MKQKLGSAWAPGPYKITFSPGHLLFMVKKAWLTDPSASEVALKMSQVIYLMDHRMRK